MDVSENFIVTLPGDGLSTVRVERVRFSRNSVRHIAATAFRGRVASTLVTLDLSHNQIGHLSSGVFSPLVHLRSLNLRYNRLADVGPQVFRSLYHLHDLDLQVRSSNNCTF